MAMSFSSRSPRVFRKIAHSDWLYAGFGYFFVVLHGASRDAYRADHDTVLVDNGEAARKADKSVVGNFNVIK
jgi:hypothetical protein